eukprot:INCI7333.1.p1 GENE.INCI7333.1~~INCI7333.1.p1  ORF type:complete len:339 (+),score=88.10 INCI7333.1:285-1301(+)
MSASSKKSSAASVAKRVPASVVRVVSATASAAPSTATTATAAAVEATAAATSKAGTGSDGSENTRKRKAALEETQDMTPEEREQLKRKRLELNRLAAIKSRKKKKAYMANLASRAEGLTEENKKLWADNKQLKNVYSQLRTAYMKAFQDNVSMRQSLTTLRKAFESVVSAAGAEGTPASRDKRIAAAEATAAPILQKLQQEQDANSTAGSAAEGGAGSDIVFPAVLPTTTDGTGASLDGGGEGALDYTEENFAKRFPETAAGKVAAPAPAKRTMNPNRAKRRAGKEKTAAESNGNDEDSSSEEAAQEGKRGRGRPRKRGEKPSANVAAATLAGLGGRN